MKIESYDSLTLEKILTLHNAIILIKSVFNKGQNYYYYNIFFRKMFLNISLKIMTKML